MSIETTGGALRAALRLLDGTVERRSTIPILSAVRFHDGTVTGTDLDSELSVALPVAGDGGVVLDMRGMARLAAFIPPDAAVRIEDGAASATVAFNGSFYRMPRFDPAEFPTFAPVDGPATEMSNLGLVAAMRRIAFAASTEMTRYYLNGVALIAGPWGETVAVATNGHMLAMARLPVMPEGGAGTIIPNRVAALLIRAGLEPERATFNAEKCRIALDLPGAKIAAKAIDGTYPDIFRVIPRDPEPVFSLHRVKALAVLKRMRSFVVGSFGIAKLSAGPGARVVSVEWGRGDDYGGRESLPVVDAPAEPFECGYNIHYLIAILSRFSGETVTFAASGSLAANPVQMTAGDGLTAVLMPARV